MRNRLNNFISGRACVLACALASALLVGVASTAAYAAQDRPLFKPGTAPARVAADDAATSPAPATGGAGEAGSLAAGSGRSFAGELLPTGLALGATLLVIVLARSAIKRFGGNLPGARRPQGVVEVLARYPIARGQQVVLLKVGRRVIVAHQGGQGMQALSEFTAEADVADLLARCEAGSRAASGFSFDALLRQSGRRLEQAEPEVAAPRTAATKASARRAELPDFMRNAEIETVDLTRNRRGGAR